MPPGGSSWIASTDRACFAGNPGATREHCAGPRPPASPIGTSAGTACGAGWSQPTARDCAAG
jgi:hypothetical protein